MKNKKLGNKGIMYAWITILVSIFVVMITFIVLDNLVQTTLVDLAVKMNVNSGLMNNLKTMWMASPVVFIIGLFLAGLIWSQRKEGDSMQY